MTPLQLELTRLIGKKELTEGMLYFYRPQTPSNFPAPYELQVKKYDGCSEFPNHWGETGEIIGHPATLTDFHRWIIQKFKYGFEHSDDEFTEGITIHVLNRSTVKMDGSHYIFIPYDSSKELLEQSEETLKQIIDIIKSSSL